MAIYITEAGIKRIINTLYPNLSAKKKYSLFLEVVDERNRDDSEKEIEKLIWKVHNK